MIQQSLGLNELGVSYEIVINFSTDSLLKDGGEHLNTIKKHLESLKTNPQLSARIRTASPLILLLIPLIVPLRNRLTVEIEFESEGKSSTMTTYDEPIRVRKFKELLEASKSLRKAGIDVVYSKALLFS